MDIDDEGFLVLANKDKEEWNDWVSDLKQETPKQYIDIKITRFDTIQKLFSNEGFDGFSGFDFSIVRLTIHQVIFSEMSSEAGQRNLLKNVKGLRGLDVTDCSGTMPGLWLEDIEIQQISISGPMDNDDSKSLRINGGVHIKNCSFVSMGGVSLRAVSINSFYLHNCKFIENINSNLYARDVVFDYLFFLNGSYFCSWTVLKNCTFNEPSYIRDVTFIGYVEFTNCNFLDRTDFQGTTFTIPPRFNGSSLNSQTLFPNEEYFNVLYSKDKSFINIHVAAFQLLKTESSKLLDRRTQGMFFSLEQKYLRQSDRINSLEKGLSWLYDITSSYGRSAVRPLLYLFIIMIMFTILFSAMKSEVISFALPFSETIIVDSFKMSLANIFLPFKVILQKGIEIPVLLLSIIQSVLSLSLITLSLLALRWSFRRD